MTPLRFIEIEDLYLNFVGETEGVILSFTGDFEGILSPNTTYLTLGPGSDTLNVSALNQSYVVRAGAGNDTVTSGSGNDWIFGEAGNDSLSGGTGNDTLLGGANDDYIDGEQGADLMVGGSGNDTIVMGDGVTGDAGDIGYGGEGNDTFITRATASPGATAYGGNGDDFFRGSYYPSAEYLTVHGESGKDLFEAAGGFVVADFNWDDDAIYVDNTSPISPSHLGLSTSYIRIDPFANGITNFHYDDRSDGPVHFGLLYTLRLQGDYSDAIGVIEQRQVNGQLQDVIVLNRAPTANPETVTTDEDLIIDLTAQLLANDTDPDRADTSLSISGVPSATSAQGADLSILGGRLFYNPKASAFLQLLQSGESAVDRFQYTISDGRGGTDTAEATIIVQGRNDVPIAGLTEASTLENRVLTIDPNGPGNTDPDLSDLGGLFYSAIDTTTHQTMGSVRLVNGEIVYDPGALFDSLSGGASPDRAFDTIGVTLSDPSGATDTATIRITVLGENDAPVAVNDTLAVKADETRFVVATTNDSDVDQNDKLSISGLIGTNLIQGLAGISADGQSIIYNPNKAFDALGVGDTATETFSYTLTDDKGGTDTANVTVTIEGVNDAPVAQNDLLNSLVKENGTLQFSFPSDVLANDFDPDAGQAPNFSWVTGIDGGSFGPGLYGQPFLLNSGAELTVDQNGLATFDPNGIAEFLSLGEIAIVSVDYTISDGLLSDTATIGITIVGENDAPIAVDDQFSTQADAPFLGLLFNGNGGAADSDPDQSDTFSLTAVNGDPNLVGRTFQLQSGATVTVGISSIVAYDPSNAASLVPLDVGQTATDSFTYTITDNHGLTDTATVTISVSGVNDAPIAVDDKGTTLSNAVLSVDAISGLLSNDTDPDIADAGKLNIVSVNGQALLAPVGQTPSTVITFPSGAELTVYSDGRYSFDPKSGYGFLPIGASTTESVFYTVSDGDLTDVGRLEITVSAPPNLPPVFNLANSTTSLMLTEDDAAIFIDPELVVRHTLEFRDPNILLGGTTTESFARTLSFVSTTAQDGKQLGLLLGAVTSVDVTSGVSVGELFLSYGVENAKIQYLGLGDTIVETYLATVRDSAGNTDTVTLTYTIKGANDDPVAVNDTATVDEDGSVAIAFADLLSNDSDVDANDTLSISGFTQAANGTVVENGVGAFVYTPNANFNGVDSFTYTVSDGKGGTDTATVTITVNSVNDAPVAVDDSGGFQTEDNTIAYLVPYNMLSNDSDADGDTLTVAAINGNAFSDTVPVTLASGALLNVNSIGEYWIDPNGKYNHLAAGESATETFSYTVSDGNGKTDNATVSFEIFGLNDAPEGVDDSATAIRNQILTVDATNGLLSNDTDPDTSDAGKLHVTSVNGQSLTGQPGKTVLQLLSGSQLTVNADGSYEFNPNGAYFHLHPGQTGTETITYTVSDGGETDTAELTVTIKTPPNQAPEFQDRFNQYSFSYYEFEAQPFEDGGPGTTYGSSFTFIDPDQGLDTFTATFKLNSVNTPNGVPLFVPVADPPSWTATAGFGNGYIATIDTRFTVPDAITDGGYIQGLSGGDQLIHKYDLIVTDSNGATDTRTVTYTIMGVNDSPHAIDDTHVVDEDRTLSVDAASGLLSNDIEIDRNDTLSVLSVGSGTSLNGRYTISGDGSFTYTPNKDFFGTDYFRYRITDGGPYNPLANDEGTVTITVNPINDAPVAVDDSGAVQSEDNTITSLIPDNMLSNDSDVDGDALTVTAINGNAFSDTTPVALASGALLNVKSTGEYWIDANGKYEYLAAGETATETFTYTLSDGNGETDTATVTFTIDGRNDAPVAVNDTASVDQNGSVAIAFLDLLSNDTDVDATDTFWISGSTQATNGTVTQNGFGAFVYTPNANFNGTDSFTYTITDGAETDTATVTVTVNPGNSAPVGGNDFATTDARTPLFLFAEDLLANDSDPDQGASLRILNVDETSALGASVGFDGNQIVFDPTIGAAGQTPIDFLTLDEGETFIDTFSYIVADEFGETAPVTVTITGAGFNDPATVIVPDIVVDVAEDSRDNPIDGLQILDVDSESLRVTINASSTVTLGVTDGLDFTVGDGFDDETMSFFGTLADINAALSTLTYSPSPDVFGNGSIEIIADDGSGPPVRGTVNIGIAGINDAPKAVADAYSVDEDGTLVVAAANGLLANDTDIDDVAIQVLTTPASGPSNGTLSLGTDGSFTYTPDADFFGTDSFTYTLTDGRLTDTATVTLTVNPVNDAPVIDTSLSNNGIFITEDAGFSGLGILGSSSIQRLFNITYTDPDYLANGPVQFFNEKFTFQSTTSPDGGQLLGFLNPLGAGLNTSGPAPTDPIRVSSSWEYRIGNNLLQGLKENQSITEKYLYSVTDSAGASDQMEFSVIFIGKNDVPIVNDDFLTVDEDGELLNFDALLLANDSDVEQETLSIKSITARMFEGYNTITATANGGFEFRAPADFNGLLTYLYEVTDGTDTVIGRAQVRVNAVNDDPILTIPTSNPVVDAGQSITVSTSVADADFAETAGATMTLTVSVTNGTVLVGDPGISGLTVNASADGRSAVITASDMVNANIALGNLTFTPDSGADMVVSITANDGGATGNGGGNDVTRTFTIDVNDPPMISDAFAGLLENGSFTIDVLSLVTDPDNTITAGDITLSNVMAAGQSVSMSDVGASYDNVTGILTVDLSASTFFDFLHGERTQGNPPTTSFGLSRLTIDATVTDGRLTDTGLIDFAVVGENDAPTAVDDIVSVNEDSGNTLINVLANDTDPDAGTVLSIQSFTDPSNGSVSLDPNGGGFFYQPTLDFSGTDSFTYVVEDGEGGSDTATVTITVLPIADPANVNLTGRSAFGLNGQEDTDLPVAISALIADTDGSERIASVKLLGLPAGTVVSDGTNSATVSVSTPEVDLAGFNLGTLVLTPPLNFNGSVLVDVVVETREIDAQGNDIPLAAPGFVARPFTVSFAPVNDAPIAVDDNVSAAENGFGFVDVINSTGPATADTDVDGDPLTITEINGIAVNPNVAFTLPSGALLNVNPQGLIVYDPNGKFDFLSPGQDAPDSFTYTVDDGNGGSDMATVNVTIQGVNTAPNALADNFATDEDTPLVIDAASGLLVNDSDAEGNPLTVLPNPVSGPFLGSVQLSSDGSFVYTPYGNNNGTDTFQYSVSDGNGGISVATATVTVNPVNDLPIIDTFSFNTILSNQVTEDDPAFAAIPELRAGLWIEFNDPDSGQTYTGQATFLSTSLADGIQRGSVLPGSLVQQPRGSSFPEGDMYYQFEIPNADIQFLGAGESFVESYRLTLRDGEGGSDTADATIQIYGVNDDPNAVSDAYSTNQNTGLSISAAAGLLSNDTDVDGDTLRVITTPVSGPSGGLLTLGADGAFTYTPNANFSGTDSFQYRVTDDQGGTDIETVTITVNAVNNAPLAGDDEAETSADTPLLLSAEDLLANDDDPDPGSVLRIISVDSSSALGASITFDGDQIIFDPTLGPEGQTPIDFLVLAEGETAPDSFTYTISDESGETDTATVFVTANGVNDPPIAVDDTARTDEDSVVALNSWFFNDIEPEQGPLRMFAFAGVNENDPSFLNTPVILASGAQVTFDFNTSQFIYDPNGQFDALAAGQTATDSFTYSIRDDGGLTDTATVTVTIDGVDDVPLATNDAFSLNEDAGNTQLFVLTNDTGAAANITATTLPSNGILQIDASGQHLIYAPNLDFSGTDTFDYTITSIDGTTDTATVTVTVDPVADPANINLIGRSPLGLNGFEEQPIDIEVQAAIADLDGSEIITALTLSGLPLGTIVSDGRNTGQITNQTPAIDLLGFNLATLVLTPPTDFAGIMGAVLEATTVETDAGGVPLPNLAGATASRTVNLTFQNINDDPIAVDDTQVQTEDFTIAFLVAPNLLTNDSDPDADPLLVTAINGNAFSNTIPVTLGSGALLGIKDTGEFTFDPNDKFEYLSGGQTAIDQFTYTISDGNGGSDTATATVTILGMNDDPNAGDDAYSTDEDTTLTVSASAGLLSNDTDVDTGASLTVSTLPVNGPSHGSVTLNADGSFQYTPDPDYYGTDSFDYLLTDGQGGSDVATVTLTINSVNDAPVIVSPTAPITVFATEDDNTILSGPLLLVSFPTFVVTDDVHPGSSWGAGLTFVATDAVDGQQRSVVSGLGGSQAVVNHPNGPATYEASLYTTIPVLNTDIQQLGINDTITETFRFEASDGLGGTDWLAISLVIQGANDDPVAIADAYSVNEDSTLSVGAPAGLLSNDTDVDTGDTKSVFGWSNASNGTVSVNGDGSFTYTPDADFNGTDSFTYTVQDSQGATDTGTVTITVDPVNDAPVITIPNPLPVVDEDATVAVPISISDVDFADTPGATFVVEVSFTDAEFARIHVLNASQSSIGRSFLTGYFDTLADVNATLASIVLEPDPDFFGTVNVKVVANDGGATGAGGGLPVTKTFGVTVNPIQDDPDAVDDAYAVNKDTVLTITAPDGVLLNDTDVDGDTLTVATAPVSGPSNGTLALASDGSFVYTPDTFFFGTDSFQYRVNDGQGGTDVATVTLTVNNINTPPDAVDDFGRTDKNTAKDIGSPLLNDMDPNLDTITLFEFAGILDSEQRFFDTPNVLPSGATIEFNGVTGSFVYDPNGQFDTLAIGQTATDSFTYTIRDDFGATDVATVTITIDGDGVVATDDSFTVAEDSGNSQFFVLTNDQISLSGSALSIQSTGLAANGSVSIDPSGMSLIYQPNLDFSGNDSFTYTITDALGQTDTATVTVTIDPVADLANVNLTGFPPQGLSGPVDAPIVFDIFAAIGDLDGSEILTILRLDNLPVGTVVEGEDISQPGTPLSQTVSAGAPSVDLTLFDIGLPLILTPPLGFTGAMPVDLVAQTVEVDSQGVPIAGIAASLVSSPFTFTFGQQPPPNTPPVAVGDSFTAIQNSGPVELDLLENDSDPDGDGIVVDSIAGTVLTPGFAQFIPVTGGVVEITDAGVIQFLADDGFTGDAAFDYTVSDGLDSTQGNVVVTITPLGGSGEPPVASNIAVAVFEEGPAGTFDFPVTDADVGDTFTFELVTTPFVDPDPGSQPQTTDNLDGTFTFDPNGAYSNLAQGGFTTDGFTFRATDSQDNVSNDGFVSLTIIGQDDPADTTLAQIVGIDGSSIPDPASVAELFIMPGGAQSLEVLNFDPLVDTIDASQLGIDSAAAIADLIATATELTATNDLVLSAPGLDPATDADDTEMIFVGVRQVDLSSSWFIV